MIGRPSTYTEEVGAEICDRIACGESLAGICREDGMPPMRTVMAWLRAQPAFQQNYIRAREDQGDTDADGVADIRERMLSGEIDPQAARVAIDSLKWTAGKRQPKKYGDRQHTELSGRVEYSNLTEEEIDARLAALAANGSAPPTA